MGAFAWNRGSRVIMPGMFLIGFGLVVSVADTVPRYDVRPTCRAAVDMIAGGAGGRTVENFLAGEEGARKELEKDWSRVPIAERTQCVATMTKGGSPSYVELAVCLDMMRDSRSHLEEERSKKTQKQTGKR
jgi:hypothetical protein